MDFIGMDIDMNYMDDDDSDDNMDDFLIFRRLHANNFDMTDEQLRDWQREAIEECEYENTSNDYTEYLRELPLQQRNDGHRLRERMDENPLQERIDELKEAIRDTYSRRLNWWGRRRGHEDFFA